MARKLFAINPQLDRATLAQKFTACSRVQIRNVLTDETAQEVRSILATQTPWGIATQAGVAAEPGPQSIPAPELSSAAGKQRMQAGAQAAHQAMAKGDYGFLYAHYPLVEAYLQKWNPAGPHDLLLEYLNTPDFLDLVRAVTGIPELVKADGQATLYAPQHYLAKHIDSHVAEGWRVAYVLNMTVDNWQIDWGGYLQFFDDDGDVIEAFRPRFNTLNLFLVPQAHAVSYVPPFAPIGRYAITGWLRDR